MHFFFIYEHTMFPTNFRQSKTGQATTASRHNGRSNTATTDGRGYWHAGTDGGNSGPNKCPTIYGNEWTWHGSAATRLVPSNPLTFFMKGDAVMSISHKTLSMLKVKVFPFCESFAPILHHMNRIL